VRPLAVDGDDDPHAEKVEIDREARPQAGANGSITSGELSWESRTLEEQLSAAGAATQAPDRAATSDRGELNGGNQRDRAFGVVFNPKWSSETWLSETRNVNCRELSRIEQLRDAWYGKALVGDGADIVDRMDLDAWQKFAYDVVMDGRHSLSSPLRLFMLGSAGTGKSRTVRACVHGRRQRVRLSYEHELFRAGLAARQREESGASRTAARTEAEKEAAKKFLSMLGVSQQEVDAFVMAEETGHLRPEGAGTGKSRGKNKKRSQRVTQVQEKVDEHVRNSCMLAAPTGCASFQLKFGASTLHRVFGIPVGYCGPWKSRTDGRYLKMKTRLTQSRLFVFDEMSMVGRQMLGKIEFKVRDSLRGAARDE
jgi:hypothetical protein